jgi:hypothetical protein
MRRNLVLFLVLFAFANASAQSLEAGFRDPPASARPHTWYHLMNGNVTRAGITRDFEALATAGIGGATLIDVASGIPAGDLAFNSEDWFGLVEHAASEARRLGLELCLENCSGWSAAGGPWVTPDLAMKSLVWTETRATGPARFSGVLPRTSQDNGFYRDIAVLAFPTPAAELAGNPLRIADHAKKIFADRDKNDFRFDNLAATPEAAAGQAIDGASLVDLSSAMASDGSLDWQMPGGDWTILRFGYICNGVCNHPATAQGVGLEIDKLSAAAAEAHFDRYMARICDRLGPLAGNVTSGLNAVLIDSHEVGCQNWTDGFEAAFGETAGYPLRPWMPVLAGRVVGDTGSSERFLEDFRRVIADLFAKNYAGRYAEKCHARGLQLQIEPYGNCPSDDLQYGAAADVPMAEFWSRAALGDHSVDTRNSRMAAHLAHVWGRRVAAAEAFTGDPAVGSRWLTTPFTIKAQGDRAFANGINRVVYHRFVHQPWTDVDRLPGMTMGKYGMHFDRTQTWWQHVGPWLLYQARCQWMLQEGTFCADVLFFGGDEAPNGVGYDSQPLGGHGWDICATEALEALTVSNGRIVAPGGVSYALLALPSRAFASARALRAVERLLDAGARVCCEQRPTRAYGAPGQSGADETIRADVARIWANGVMECAPAAALQRLGIERDFRVPEAVERAGASFIHRRDGSADWYFVALNNEETIEFEASFREAGRVPEIWNAETGEIAEAALWRVESGRTTVALSLPPSGSVFVVFRTSASSPSSSSSPSSATLVSGPWQVTFPVAWYSGGAAVKTRDWPALQDWTSDDDPDIRYFSGTATYRTSFELKMENGKLPGQVMLDLGDVRNFAEVTVNGKTFPVLWRPPYRVDITDALPQAEDATNEFSIFNFQFSIRVTNLWPNRLIGDDFLEDDCNWRSGTNGDRRDGLWSIPDWVTRGEPSPTGRHTFTTWRHWTKDDTPLPSGLLGPVTVSVPGDGSAGGSSTPLGENEYEVHVPLGVTRLVGAALVADIGAKNLVKTGRGKLVSANVMSNYTGTITIREGALEIHETSDLGTSAGGTVVEDGGTLVVAMFSSNVSPDEAITIAGAGDPAYGAAVWQADRSNDQFKFFKDLRLSGDATIYAGTRLGVNWGSLAMNGHTLTVRGANFMLRAILNLATPGDIVSEVSGFAFDGNGRYNDIGDAARTFTVRNGSTVNLTNATQTPRWTLVVEEGGRVISNSSAARAWGGDVVWNATTADGAAGFLDFPGEVTGTGIIKASSGTLTFANPLGEHLRLELSGTARVVLPPPSGIYGRGGLMIARLNKAGGFNDFRDGKVTEWRRCPEGPGPLLDKRYWKKGYWGESPEDETIGGGWTLGAKGYIWNRDPTNVSFHVSARCLYKSYVRFGESNAAAWFIARNNNIDQDDEVAIPAQSCLAFFAVVEGAGNGDPGPYNPNTTLRFSDGRELRDEGDGYLFTIDNRTRAEYEAELARKTVLFVM